MVAQARVSNQTYVNIEYPAESIVSLSVNDGTAISPIPDHVKQLDMRHSSPCLKEGVITKHLTHLLVQKLTNAMAIPDTLEHLFVHCHNQSTVSPLPKVKNLYFHADFVDHKSDPIPVEHYVFYWGGQTISKAGLQEDKYDLIGQQTDIDAFDRTVRVIKRVPKTKAAPESKPIVPKPAVEILTVEKIKALTLINAQAMEALYSPEVTEIVTKVTEGIEAAAKAGKLSSFSYTHTVADTTVSFDIIKIVQKYLPTMTVSAGSCFGVIKVSI